MDAKSSSKIAVISLIVAAFSMVGTLTNSVVAVWQHSEAQSSKAPNVTIRCRLKHNSRIEVEPASNFAFGMPAIRFENMSGDAKKIDMKFNDTRPGIESFRFLDSSGQVETTVDLNAYPKMLIATMECLVVK